MSNPLRMVPPINEFIEHSALQQIKEEVGRENLKKMVREVIDEKKRTLLDAMKEKEESKTMLLTKEGLKKELIGHIQKRFEKRSRNQIRRLINGTGIVLHTNMGRAPLPKQAVERISEIASGYCNLEYSLEEGRRGSRYAGVEELLVDITGAESALVVNNNAAAVFLCLHELAKDKEVIVARSEQVEIGGSFRVPEIIEQSGAKMVEVGTTNKTYIRDFQRALTEETAVLLKVHKSNYRIEGFTSEVKGEELVELAKESETILIEDVGSGVLVDLRPYGLPEEPTVQSLVEKGIDLVTFSGDKLLGGPQAGIIVGKKELIDRIKYNPLTRMVRVDKLSLIALEEVLRIYSKDLADLSELPGLDMLTISHEELQIKAEGLYQQIQRTHIPGLTVETVPCTDQPGGGSLPGSMLKGAGVAINFKHLSADQVQCMLRENGIPIICIVNENKVILSLRTIMEEDYENIIDALHKLASV